MKVEGGIENDQKDHSFSIEAQRKISPFFKTFQGMKKFQETLEYEEVFVAFTMKFSWCPY